MSVQDIYLLLVDDPLAATKQPILIMCYFLRASEVH